MNLTEVLQWLDAINPQVTQLTYESNEELTKAMMLDISRFNATHLAKVKYLYVQAYGPAIDHTHSGRSMPTSDYIDLVVRGLRRKQGCHWNIFNRIKLNSRQ